MSYTGIIMLMARGETISTRSLEECLRRSEGSRNIFIISELKLRPSSSSAGISRPI